MQSQWKLCQLQLKSWGSSTYVRYFPSVSFLDWRVLDITCAGASGTMTVDDQRSYTKIKTLRGKNHSEIHVVLREVCGEQTVDRSTVSRWATCFVMDVSP
jgi:hypothetical protein